MATLIDSYSETNSNSQSLWIRDIQPLGGCSFANTDAMYIASCKFYLSKSGTLSGNMRAKLYSHSGTYGTSSIGATLLATSDDVAASVVTASAALVEFTFSGAQRYQMAAGTKYVIVLEYTETASPNYIISWGDNTSPAHGGNPTYYDTAWQYFTTEDLCFYVYGDATLPAGGTNAFRSLLGVGI